MNEELRKKIQCEVSEKDKFGTLLDIRITEADTGYCKGEMTIKPTHKNPLGTVHGGCLYTLADTVGGMAAASCGMGGPTISGNMYFMRPTLESEKLICEANVIKNGKRVRVVEVIISDNMENEIARSILEYMDLQKKVMK